MTTRVEEREEIRSTADSGITMNMLFAPILCFYFTRNNAQALLIQAIHLQFAK
jgi:hypothetical protein